MTSHVLTFFFFLSSSLNVEEQYLELKNVIIWSELFHLGDREIPLTTISHRKAPHYVLKGPSLLAMIVLAMEF